MRPSAGRGEIMGACLGAVLLAGCATTGPSNNGSVNDSNSSGHQKVGGIVLPTAARSDFTPYRWPSPDADIWANVRSGFVMDAHRARPRVREWTQYYATHTRHLQTSLRRARPWLYHVVEQVEARDLPTEIALLPIVESGYNPTAESYAGASGMWQFMPGTAKLMHLSEDWWYDGREDPIASTRAALDYLTQLNARYDGSWPLTLAAYNAGPGRVDRARAGAMAAGEPADYWHLDLPAETLNYVPKLLALRWIMQKPAQFGVSWPRLANEPKTREVELPGQTQLSVAANMLDMATADLKKLNPDIQHHASRPDDNARLIVPAQKAAAFKSQLIAINPAKLIKRRRHRVHRGETLARIARRFDVSVAALRQTNGLASNRILAGQTLRIPNASGTPTPGAGTPASPPSSPTTHRYTVQPGDTLWSIAHGNDTSVAAIRRANPSLGDTLQPGEPLTLSGRATAPAPTKIVVGGGDTLWAIANKNHVSVADLRRWNHIADSQALRKGQTLAVDGPAPVPDYYQVESGDSLWSIASHFSMKVATLRQLNDLTADSSIQPGQRLRLQPAVSS